MGYEGRQDIVLLPMAHAAHIKKIKQAPKYLLCKADPSEEQADTQRHIQRNHMNLCEANIASYIENTQRKPQSWPWHGEGSVAEDNGVKGLRRQLEDFDNCGCLRHYSSSYCSQNWVTKYLTEATWGRACYDWVWQSMVPCGLEWLQACEVAHLLLGQEAEKRVQSKPRLYILRSPTPPENPLCLWKYFTCLKTSPLAGDQVFQRMSLRGRFYS